MVFKLFKQNGKDVIINLDNIISIKSDDTSKKTVIYSTGQTNEVDESFEDVKYLFGVSAKKAVKGF